MALLPCFRYGSCFEHLPEQFEKFLIFDVPSNFGYANLKKTSADKLTKTDLDNPLWTKVLRHAPTVTVMPGLTEVGDVSQITPTS